MTPSRAIPPLLSMLLLLGGASAPALAQDSPRWERRSEAATPPPAIFHATQALNLPTAVTPGRSPCDCL